MKYLLLLLLAACASAKPPIAGDQAAFDAAVDRMVTNDQRHDWTAAECRDVAQSFDRIQGSAYALYNAGLAHRRCNDDVTAKTKFEAALDLDPSLKHANAQLSSLRAKESGNPDADTDAKAPPLRRDGRADSRAFFAK